MKFYLMNWNWILRSSTKSLSSGKNEWMDEWMKEWMNAWMKEWMEGWMNECIKGWMSERMNEWRNCQIVCYGS